MGFKLTINKNGVLEKAELVDETGFVIPYSVRGASKEVDKICDLKKLFLENTRIRMSEFL